MNFKPQTFTTSRLLDFASEKELQAQTGHAVADWPLVILKELIDNALDACEDANIAPVVHIVIDARGISVKDNGPGIPSATVERLCDFAVRVSSREAYVAPTRGAQGNALKTVLAMPFVLGGTGTAIGIAARGLSHSVAFRVDHVRGQPVVDLRTASDRIVKTGTLVEVAWPVSARSQLDDAKDRILQIASDFGWLNPSLSLSLDWFGDKLISHKATNRDWLKWKPSDPQPPAWYSLERFQRRIAAYVSDDAANGRSRTVREFVAEFRGLSSSAKGAAVLAETGLSGAQLADLVDDKGFDDKRTSALLKAMQGHSKEVKPSALGIIGREHFEARLKAAGCEMESFDYRKVEDHNEDGIPFLIEVAFGWLGDAAPAERRLVTGVSGFSIAGTLQRDTRRHTFERGGIEVHDLGLRIGDIAGLESEPVTHGKASLGAVRANLRENGAKEDEVEFLLTKRVELNALASDELVAFIERKLDALKIRKLAPDKATLDEAVLRVRTMTLANEKIKDLLAEAAEQAQALKPVAQLERKVRALLKDNPALPWDAAVAQIVKNGGR